MLKVWKKSIQRENDACYHNLSVVDGEVVLLLVEAGEVDRLHVVDVDQVGDGGRLVEELVEHYLWFGDRTAWMSELS